jgi:hypothetical protein
VFFHVELRKFPHTAWAFNLGEAELFETLVLPWSRGQWVEMGERKWNPNEARLTVLEGPHLEVGDLAMGRGWGNAQRRSEDVTKRVIARARASQRAGGAQTDGGGGAPATAAPGDRRAGADGPPAGAPDPQQQQLLLSLLGTDPAGLLQAWRLAAERRPELSPSESLALAESTLRSLDAGSS